MGEVSPDELKELQTVECTCSALTYWKDKAEKLYKALDSIPHTCRERPHIECAGCRARSALGGGDRDGGAKREASD